MLPLIMIIAAPVLQIVLSTLRIAGLINKPIGVIAALSFVAGILLSALSVSIVNGGITAGS